MLRKLKRSNEWNKFCVRGNGHSFRIRADCAPNISNKGENQHGGRLFARKLIIERKGSRLRLGSSGQILTEPGEKKPYVEDRCEKKKWGHATR